MWAADALFLCGSWASCRNKIKMCLKGVKELNLLVTTAWWLFCGFSELLSSTPMLFIATTGAVLQLNANSLELEDWFSLQGTTTLTNNNRTVITFYCAMHYSAKRGIAIACRLVCLSVCLSNTFALRSKRPSAGGTWGHLGRQEVGWEKVACWRTKAAISLKRVKVEEKLP